MFFNVLQKRGEDSPDDIDQNGMALLQQEDGTNGALAKNKGIMKNKIQFVSKMLKMQRVLREESEQVIKIKALNNNKLPQGILLDGKEALEAFTAFKKVDSKNERRPY